MAKNLDARYLHLFRDEKEWQKSGKSATIKRDTVRCYSFLFASSAASNKFFCFIGCLFLYHTWWCSRVTSGSILRSRSWHREDLMGCWGSNSGRLSYPMRYNSHHQINSSFKWFVLPMNFSCEIHEKESANALLAHSLCWQGHGFSYSLRRDSQVFFLILALYYDLSCFLTCEEGVTTISVSKTTWLPSTNT